MTSLLPDADWRHRPGLDALLRALGAEQGLARFVGGAVRDGLLGLPVNDLDIATVLEPQSVIDRLKAAGIKAVPTGIDHGTITAVINGWPVEITTLRRDVSTDGRRATIAYTDDWREDAARRDFTINALYADPLTHAITDFFGGVADLRAHRVRFIGDAGARIAEDHLRILRYFRFLARFGHDEPDDEAYAACRQAANSLMALSRERIADELLKLLALPRPLASLRLMVDGGILLPVLPEVDHGGLARLSALIDREAASGTAPAALRRLAALLPPDPRVADQVGARLKLSNKARKRLATALEGAASAPPRALAFRIGVEGAIDRMLIDPSAPLNDMKLLAGWTPPRLPLGGGALIERGLQPGPDVAKALAEVQDIWVAEGFPDEARLSEIADQTVSKFQRARQ
ncbi:CCA tRNA nucleotidyltransferase [Sphingobium indicum]|uniref:Polynucleotide adenylyltransferase n=2 Tax=Sphingobium indicum TaxID=332055 RepID=A0A1L5BN54_SPHIB|nr:MULTISPECIES: CCA tRNA nucleotidyltransferase [Sphingobium]EPR16567.1 polynucleotide adenylyltransferase [Sphingobium indicum IP26]KEY99678.1 polynucleotide adenylyltransferase [Sphingomonas sp. BHC-A]APL94309.1 polynucleotide adenylyltransferase [Sphingobium indicum B90A]EQA98751.1 polynucleotide adenylyltransferase [Sphingobium sp. HDIP04]NYI21134.1 poly(A) polymerase [Sphingobium indicum]